MEEKKGAGSKLLRLILILLFFEPSPQPPSPPTSPSFRVLGPPLGLGFRWLDGGSRICMPPPPVRRFTLLACPPASPSSSPSLEAPSSQPRSSSSSESVGVDPLVWPLPAVPPPRLHPPSSRCELEVGPGRGARRRHGRLLISPTSPLSCSPVRTARAGHGSQPGQDIGLSWRRGRAQGSKTLTGPAVRGW